MRATLSLDEVTRSVLTNYDELRTREGSGARSARTVDKSSSPELLVVAATIAAERRATSRFASGSGERRVESRRGTTIDEGQRAEAQCDRARQCERVRAAIRTALAWGWIENADEQLAMLDRLLALLRRINFPRRA